MADESLSSGELERVIRRAAELQTAREDLPEHLDESEVLRIGREVGLHEAHVRRALLELHSEALALYEDDSDSFAARAWGSSSVRARRVVPGPAVEVQRRLETELRTAESLVPLRNRAGVSVWKPASDVVSMVRRGINLAGHGFALAGARRIEVSVYEVEEGRCSVTLVADLRNQRAEHVGGWYTGAGASSIGLTLVGTLAVGLPVLLVAPLALGAMFGSGTWLARRTLASEREKVQISLEGLLDRLEGGGTLEAARPALIDRLQGLITERDQERD